MIQSPNNEILIYQTLDGKIKIETKLQDEIVWLTIEQRSKLFQKSCSTINEHILNIYYDFSNIKVVLMSKSKFLLYLSYNSCNNTPQASLQSSPRGVTF